MFVDDGSIQILNLLRSIENLKVIGKLFELVIIQDQICERSVCRIAMENIYNLDSDDEALPDKISKQLKILKK